jgi:3-hydroxyisobutyrate dehydrogenase-like beta-hydroxyacid dehydrogenase
VLEAAAMSESIGIISPGNMGVSIAASAINSGNHVYWASQGRSAETRQRAEEHGLIDAGSLRELCSVATIMLSVVPPSAAEGVAEQVAAQNFKGTFADLNAISPQRARRIAERLGASGIEFVDGGIVGPPAWRPRTTWLCLSGNDAGTIASCFGNGPLETDILGNRVGDASALKMCYGAYTKGLTALIAGVLGTAGNLGVRESLMRRWANDGSGLDKSAAPRVVRITDRAWRWVGEMEEIATTFAEADMPRGFHEAASDIYRRLAKFEGEPTPTVEAVLEAIETPAARS